MNNLNIISQNANRQFNPKLLLQNENIQYPDKEQKENDLEEEISGFESIENKELKNKNNQVQQQDVAKEDISGFEGIENNELRKESQNKQEFGTPSQFKKELGITALGTALATPKTLSEIVDYGSKWLAKKGEEQAFNRGTPLSDKQKSITGNILKFLGFPNQILEKIGYPNQEEMTGLVREYGKIFGGDTDISENPTKLEEWGQTGGRFIGSALPGGAARVGGRLATAGLSAAGEIGAKEAGLGETGQFISSMVLPVLSHLSWNIASGRFKPTSIDQKKLMDFAETYANLTPEELIPLVQGSEKANGLIGFVAKGTPKSQEYLRSTGEKLGDTFKTLRADARSVRQPLKSDVTYLVHHLQDLRNDIGTTRFQDRDTRNALKTIDQTIADIKKRGLNAESAIQTYRSLNSSVEWDKIDGGKIAITRLKDMMRGFIGEMDKPLAHRFDQLNTLYTNFSNIEKALTPSHYARWIKLGKNIGLMGDAIKNASTGNFGGVALDLTGIIGPELGQRFATNLLIDPKYQQLWLKGANALKSGNRSRAMKFINDFKGRVKKDFPRESKDIDWENVFKEDES